MNKVATKKENSMTIADDSWIKDAGMGMETASEDEFKLPLIKILYSSNMPDIENTITGTPVSEGCIYNQTSGKVYDGKDGFTVVPVYYKRSFNEWAEMTEANNRPVAVYQKKPEGLRREGNKDILPNDNYVEDTGNWFVMVLDNNDVVIDQGLITMKSTQKKKSNEWLQKLRSNIVVKDGKSLIPPGYMTKYRLATTRQESGKYKYFGWNIRFEGYLQNVETIQKTKTFAEFAKEFNLYFDPSPQQSEDSSVKSNEKVPF